MGNAETLDQDVIGLLCGAYHMTEEWVGHLESQVSHR